MFERNLSDDFINKMKKGHLKPIIDTVRLDDELDFQVRNNYINIYYRGASILKLSESRDYAVTIDKKYKGRIIGAIPTNLNTGIHVRQYLRIMPQLKQAVSRIHSHRVTRVVPAKRDTHTKNPLEAFSEQWLIRNSVYVKGVEPDIFWIDRQVAFPSALRQMDLVGVQWPRTKTRNRAKEMNLVIGEVKYGLNPDISDIAKQMEMYCNQVVEHWSDFYNNMRQVVAYKTGDLRLFRKESFAIDKLTNDPGSLALMAILVDYNPNSTRMDSVHNQLQELAARVGKKVYLHRVNLALYERDLTCFGSSS